jgi:hypothetical protein
MGAEPWAYFVPFQEDVQAAMEALQQQEFSAGRYLRLSGEGRPPATILEAIRQGGATGTQSILDMVSISDIPHEVDAEIPQFGSVAPLSTEQLIELYGTEKPSHAMVERNQEFYEWIDRGLGIYIVVYDGDQPSELFFAGYSFD